MRLRDHLWLSRSWTTRPRRPGEPEDAYVFVSREEFLEHVARGGFVEWTEFPGNGHLYGTPALAPPAGHDIVLEIELEGAKQVKAAHPDAVLVMVTAPSPQARAERLRMRGDKEADIRRRLEVGEEEQRLGAEIADHVLVNDDLERAAGELAAIVDHYRRGGAERAVVRPG
jgi:guanylate kinase